MPKLTYTERLSSIADKIADPMRFQVKRSERFVRLACGLCDWWYEMTGEPDSQVTPECPKCGNTSMQTVRL